MGIVLSSSKNRIRCEPDTKGGSKRTSAGAMLIFSVSFQIDQMPEGKGKIISIIYILLFEAKAVATRFNFHPRFILVCFVIVISVQLISVNIV